MIITCPNCNKKFKIDNSLIPDDGRDLQCGSCNHIWFYKTEVDKSATLKLKENISESKTYPDIETTDKNSKLSKKSKEEKLVKTGIKEETSKEITKTIKMSKDKGSKFFSYLIVFIISFVALIILLDTLKTPLSSVFPGLDIILFNLFETLQDIKLFIIDLI